MLWCRLHADTLNDPKVQTLPLEVFKIWINCLCFAASLESDGNIGTINDVCYALRETKETVSLAFHRLKEVELFVTVGETFHIKNWRKRQYKSDTSTLRVKRHRKRSRNVTVTAPEQSRADTEQNNPIVPFRDSLAEMTYFPDFWHLFPHKTEQGFARNAYRKALTITTHEVIMAALKKQLPALAVKTHPIPNPAKWLAGECWSDAPPAIVPKREYSPGF